jgi:hypothetical protein
MTKPSHRKVNVDGLNGFYREAVGRMHGPSSYFTVFQLRATRFDAGHFALETRAEEITKAMQDFLIH